MRPPSPTPVLLALTALIAGCAGTPERPDFDSAVSGDRINAIVSAPDDDPATRFQLVEQLDAVDELVRMLAITRLEAETGESLGFDYDAGLTAREVWVERWVAREEVPP